MQNHTPGVKGHRQAFARTLRVPHHTHAAVARYATGLALGKIAAMFFIDAQMRRAQSLFHRHVHRVKLMIARHLLDELAATRILEHDEVPHQIEEAALLEHTFEHHLQLRQLRRGILAPGDRAPRLEPFLACTKRTDARLHAIGNQQRIGGEQRGNLRLIGLKLLVRAPHGRVFIGGVLELDHRERQTIYKQHHVRAARVLPVGHGKLIHGQPVVIVWRIEIDHFCLRTSDRAILAAILDSHAIHQHPMHGAIALDERRCIGARQLAKGIFQRIGRQVAIQPIERLAQAAFQHHVAIVRVTALGARHTDGDVRAMKDGIAQPRQPS